jgi:putative ABC transport system substrate-binding protein
MPRSSFGVLLFAFTLLCPVHAHSDAGSPRIGFLSPSTPEGSAVVLAALRQGLREHGYIEGTNITIELRFGNNRFDRLPGLARELVDMPVDVLVTYVTQASIAAKQITGTIPIVMIGVGDPVASGLVSSLSRPGANVTGTSGAFSESAGKRLQLLKEAVPSLQRVAILWNPANPIFQKQILEETNAAARQLGL